MLVQGFQNIRVLIMSMEHKMQFLSTIINEQEKWCEWMGRNCKGKMNRYLFEKKKVWKNEEFFFDGIDCEWFFSHFFYRVLICEEIYAGSIIECGTVAIYIGKKAIILQ
ncbi:AAB_G0005100.mRNA.1.CDS.1 [Saccharomyces cerevisiae]|nr:AAB_G0005100.mRNA.1.CDS.1 [Saccharomyces cerevisiae]